MSSLGSCRGVAFSSLHQIHRWSGALLGDQRGREDVVAGSERWTPSFRQLSGQIKVKSGVIGQAASGCDGAG